MKGFDGLVDFLVDKVALKGDQGIFVRAFLETTGSSTGTPSFSGQIKFIPAKIDYRGILPELASMDQRLLR